MAPKRAKLMASASRVVRQCRVKEEAAAAMDPVATREEEASRVVRQRRVKEEAAAMDPVATREEEGGEEAPVGGDEAAAAAPEVAGGEGEMAGEEAAAAREEAGAGGEHHLPEGATRTRISWMLVRAVYLALPEFQRARLERMGFGEFLRIDVLRIDVALVQSLKSRWDDESRAFIFPWGHMIPTLEDVVRITGLRIHGMASLGLRNTGVEARETPAQHLQRLIDGARERVSLAPGPGADKILRCFLILMIGKLLLGSRGDAVSCRHLPLLEDLDRVGEYAWGAAMLAHLFDSLSISTRQTSLGGFYPLLQVWSYLYLPSFGRSMEVHPGLVPIARRWMSKRDSRSLKHQMVAIQDEIDTFPYAAVIWTPYRDEADDQPWVTAGSPYFGREIWLHSLNIVEPLHYRLIMRTLGLHQALVEFPSRQTAIRLGRRFRGLQGSVDWRVRAAEQIQDWERCGRSVIVRAQSDEEYMRAFSRLYGNQVFRGTRRPFDPEGRIAELQGLLHLTIGQRDELQRTLDLLRGEIAQRQSAPAPSISSQAPADRAELDERLARTLSRAEAAEASLAEKERDLQEALSKASRMRDEVAGLRGEMERARIEVVRQEARAEALEKVIQLMGEQRHYPCSGAPSGNSYRQYFIGSSGRRRNEEERQQWREEGSTAMGPPTDWRQEDARESGGQR